MRGSAQPRRVPIKPNLAALVRTTFAEALRLHQNQQPDRAEPLYRRVLSINPKHVDSLHLLGMALHQCGKSDAAIDSIRQAINIDPSHALFHVNLGTVLGSMGKVDEAIESYQRAIRIQPDNPLAHCNLANALVAQKKFDAAKLHFNHALAIDRANPLNQLNLGVALAEEGDINGAILCYEQAITLKPDCVQALSNLGNAFQAKGWLNQAVPWYQRALQVEPNNLNTLYNLATNYQRLNRLHEAQETYNQMLRIQPDHAPALYGKSLAQLLEGNFAEGWRNYEYRFSTGDVAVPPNYSQPRWTGEKLESGRLLVWGEQGIGDEIMFAGLMPDLLKTGISPVLVCDPRLAPLFERSFPAAIVVPSSDAAIPNLEISAQIPIGSLPSLFRSTQESFAATTSPYLLPNPGLRNKFRSRYSHLKITVGLAWHTKNARTGRSRCIDLPLLAPLFANNDVYWVNLQYGDHASLEAQAQACEAPIFVDRTVDQFLDMDRFAAQVAAMDLVITIDNCTAHIAGALGVPTWVLLPFDRDWRWMQNRTDSPWYPTVSLLRQPQCGDWNPVIDLAAQNLSMLTKLKQIPDLVKRPGHSILPDLQQVA